MDSDHFQNKQLEWSRPQNGTKKKKKKEKRKQEHDRSKVKYLTFRCHRRGNENSISGCRAWQLGPTGRRQKFKLPRTANGSQECRVGDGS